MLFRSDGGTRLSVPLIDVLLSDAAAAHPGLGCLASVLSAAQRADLVLVGSLATLAVRATTCASADEAWNLVRAWSNGDSVPDVDFALAGTSFAKAVSDLRRADPTLVLTSTSARLVKARWDAGAELSTICHSLVVRFVFSALSKDFAST